MRREKQELQTEGKKNLVKDRYLVWSSFKRKSSKFGNFSSYLYIKSLLCIETSSNCSTALSQLVDSRQWTLHSLNSILNLSDVTRKFLTQSQRGRILLFVYLYRLNRSQSGFTCRWVLPILMILSNLVAFSEIALWRFSSAGRSLWLTSKAAATCIAVGNLFVLD